MRQIIIAGNWKMNASKETASTLIMGILAGLGEVQAQAIVCPPYPYLSQAQALAAHSQLHIGAQDLNINAAGAFTGEVSAEMLQDFGAKYVIVGHSERRQLYGESDEVVAEKIQTAVTAGLIPLFCIGETLSERESEATEQVLAQQINAVIERVGIQAFANIIVAYEPVWAIGTGVTATPAQAQETHSFIRDLLARHDSEIAQATPILYGGSMNPGNAPELLACEDIDGGLIGGASLKSEDFLQICKAG
ncbi:MAG: triose-phosphate isomerase [Candidatus Thioglobus sp.]|nr:triose-phosphate isomerase [Candidatus Thioglobus sp.]